MTSRSASSMTRTRLAKTTRTTANGTKVVTTKLVPDGFKEWELQHQAVRQLKKLPGYLKAMPSGPLPPGAFTLAADMNAARRGRKEATKAKATGIAAGEPDLRIYAARSRLLLIEYKTTDGKMQDSQEVRHPLLDALGHPVTTIRAAAPEDCAEKTVALVTGWLAANDNAPPHSSSALQS